MEPVSRFDPKFLKKEINSMRTKLKYVQKYKIPEVLERNLSG